MDPQKELDGLPCPACGETGSLILNARSEGYVLAVCWQQHGYDSVCRQPALFERLLMGLRLVWPAERSPADPAIPTPLAHSLTEARLCHDSGAHTAATVMVRRTLEALCADHGISDRTNRGGFKSLNAKLEELHTSNIITGQLFDWAVHLKDVGNDGAHDTTSVASSPDAADAIALAEHMLHHLYITPARYAAAKARRDREQLIKSLPVLNAEYTLDRSEDGLLTAMAMFPTEVQPDPAARVIAVAQGNDSEGNDSYDQLRADLLAKVTAALPDQGWQLGKLIQVDMHTGKPVS